MLTRMPQSASRHRRQIGVLTVLARPLVAQMVITPSIQSLQTLSFFGMTVVAADHANHTAWMGV